MTVKNCPKCSTTKPTTEFHRNSTKRDGLQGYCKSCSVTRSTAYKRALPKDVRTERAKRYNLQHFYGITPAYLDAAVAAQDGKCAVCATLLTATTKGACVDHNHATGEVRGILCSRCNVALGMFQDDPVILSSAIEYLNDKGNYAGFYRGQT